MYLRSACLLLTLLVSSISLIGIEVFLKNGDRLQGELVVESDNHLTILHPVLGEIEIAKNALAEMPLIEQKPVLIQKEEEKKAGEKGSEKQAIGISQPGIASTPSEESKIGGEAGLSKIPAYVWNSPSQFIQLLKRMNSKVGLSFADKSSKRDQTDLRFFYNSRWKNGKSEYRFDTDYRFSKTDGDTSQNRLTGNFRFRRQVQRNIFIQSTSFYKTDPIREINNFVEQGVGGGWNQKISKNFEYSLGGEASVKHEDLTAGNQAIGGTHFLTNLFQDSVYRINDNYQLIQEAETYIAPDDTENWGYRFDIKLDGNITSGFTLRLGYEYSFDNIVPKKVPQIETMFSSSVLYTF